MGNKFGKGLAQVLHRATYAAIFAIGAGALVQSASAQVLDTKHNLSATAPGANTPGSTRVNFMTGTGATTQVCVFCHTPHGAASAEAPLWQRTLAGATSYQTYGTTSASTSMDAEQGDSLAIGSVSLACLSCHDGTQAMNTMSNTPGSGHNSDGKASGTWNVTGARNTNGQLTGIANLLGDSKNLQNDHPIGIRYAGGFAYTSGAASVANTAFADKEFRDVRQASINNAPVWFVEPKTGASANTARDKNDIQLYTRAYNSGYQPYVECASCHDPHSSAELFMRVPVAGSEICLTCHIK